MCGVGWCVSRDKKLTARWNGTGCQEGDQPGEVVKTIGVVLLRGRRALRARIKRGRVRAKETKPIT